MSRKEQDGATSCKFGVAYGKESELYSFPNGHPMNNSRTRLFFEALRRFAAERPEKVSVFEPVSATDEDLLLFHKREYMDFVKRSSKEGRGFLDYGDTPSFPGVYEASLFTVGSTLLGVDGILNVDDKRFDHFFNPVGGLHHARRERAGGFCVFDDCAIAISKVLSESGIDRVAYVDIDSHHGYSDTKDKQACEIRDLRGLSRVAYVDIDCHHGDGVYYGFESDPRVIIGDIHEDGRYLYPGTGFTDETGKGEAKGTKLNIPLLPGSGDNEFTDAFDRVEEFVRGFKPEFIFFQCGADGLEGDPITHLRYSWRAHAYATKKLHKLAHEICDGRILAMGGGGYNPNNVDAAWTAVVRELSNCEAVHRE